jgi:hypothetical protein
MVGLYDCAGQEHTQKYTVEGLEVKVFDESPLKKFVTAPKLREDLAK